MAFRAAGDNAGPPMSALEVRATWKKVRSWWPSAETKIVASDLDAFTAAAAPFAESLPVVTKELGDTWVMGVPSDPEKVAKMRAMDRQLALCHAMPSCASAEGLQNFSRYWIKNSEHTWGVSVQHFGSLQKTGWNNSEFRPALADPEVASYQTLQASWVDQLNWGVDWAMAALPAAHPMQRGLAQEFRAMQPGQTNLSDGTWHKLPAAEMTSVLNGWSIGWDDRGAIVHLAGTRPGAAAGVSWATVSKPLALLRYQSLSDATFGVQMRQSYLFRHPTTVPGSSPSISGANEYYLRLIMITTRALD